MEMQELAIRRREGTGKGVARRLRRAGTVPAILYGGTAPMPITVDSKSILKIIHGHEGTTQLLSLKVEGGSDGERLEVFLSLLLGLMERLIRQSATGEGAVGEEKALADRLLDRARLPQWVEAWEEIGRAKADALTLNLDRSLLVLESLYRLQLVARGERAT